MEKCLTCVHGFDASKDGNDYGTTDYIQGCRLGFIPAMGYPCDDKCEEAEP